MKSLLKSQYFQAEKHHWVTAKGSTCFYLFYMGRRQKNNNGVFIRHKNHKSWWAALVEEFSKKTRSYKLRFGNKLWHWPLLGGDICLAFLMIILSSTGNKITCRTSSLMSMIQFRMWKLSFVLFWNFPGFSQLVLMGRNLGKPFIDYSVLNTLGERCSRISEILRYI